MSSEKPFTKQLLSAAANQDLAGVNAVLQSGSSAFDINATNKSGYSPLHFAADNDSVSIVKKISKFENCDVNLKGGHFQNTALHMAAFKGHTKTVKVLVNNKNTDFTVTNKFGQTALATALSQNQTESVELIKAKMIEVGGEVAAAAQAADGGGGGNGGEGDLFTDPVGSVTRSGSDAAQYLGDSVFYVGSALTSTPSLLTSFLGAPSDDAGKEEKKK